MNKTAIMMLIDDLNEHMDFIKEKYKDDPKTGTVILVGLRVAMIRAKDRLRFERENIEKAYNAGNFNGHHEYGVNAKDYFFKTFTPKT